MFHADTAGMATFSVVRQLKLISCLVSLSRILAGVAEELKHVKLLPGTIKTEEGQAVKELSEASWESKASLWIACKWTGNKL